MNFDRESLALFFLCAEQVAATASYRVNPSPRRSSERLWWYVVSDSAQVRRDAMQMYPDTVYPWAHPAHAHGQFNGRTFYHNYSGDSLLHTVGELLAVASCRYKLVSSRSGYGKLAALISPDAGIGTTVQIFPPVEVFSEVGTRQPLMYVNHDPTVARCGLKRTGTQELRQREDARVRFDSYEELTSSHYSEYTRW